MVVQRIGERTGIATTGHARNGCPIGNILGNTVLDDDLICGNGDGLRCLTNGKLPVVCHQVVSRGIVVCTLRNGNFDRVATCVLRFSLRTVFEILHRDSAHAVDAGIRFDRGGLGVSVIGQGRGHGKGEVACLRVSPLDCILHAGGGSLIALAHGDAGGVGARINRRCGQGAAVLLIGDLAHVRRRPPGLGQPGRLGGAVVGQVSRRLDGDAAAVGIAAEPVRIAAHGADGRAVAAQRIAPVVLMAPQHHGPALVGAADGILAGGPADEAARLDPVGVFRGGDGHGAAGGGCVFRLDGDAAGIGQLAHHGDGSVLAEIHILVGIDRAAQVQRAVVVYAVLTAGGGERAVDRDRTAGVIQAVGFVAAGVSGGGQRTVHGQRPVFIIIQSMQIFADGRQRTGDRQHTSVAQTVAAAGAGDNAVDGHGAVLRAVLIGRIVYSYVAAIRRQRTINGQRTEVVHTVISAFDGIAGGLDRTGSVHCTGVVDGILGAGNGAVIQINGAACVVCDTSAGTGDGDTEKVDGTVLGVSIVETISAAQSGGTIGTGVGDGTAGLAVSQNHMDIRLDIYRAADSGGAGDLMPIHADDSTIHWRPRRVAAQRHIAGQVVAARHLGHGGGCRALRVAAVLLLHQLICPRHELVVHVLGVITDVLGVLRLMGTGAVRMILDQMENNIAAAAGIRQVIGAVIVGEEAVQGCRTAFDHGDVRRIGKVTLLFRRDADAGAFVQLAVQRDGRAASQIDVGAVACDRRGAAHGQRAVVIHAAPGAVVGDGAAVEIARTGVIHAAAPRGGIVVVDGAAVHIECTGVIDSRAVGLAFGVPQPSVVEVERAAVVHGVGRRTAGAMDIPLDRGALRQGEGHAAVNGNDVIRGLIKSKLPDGLTIQAEHRAVRGTPCAGVTQRHIACQIVLARILGQGVGRGMAAVAVLAGRLVVRPRGVGHAAVLRMAAGRGVTAADAVDMGIQADIVVAGLPDLGMAPVQHGGIIAGIAVLPPVVPGCAAVEKVCDLAVAELVLCLAAVAVVAVCAVVAIYDLAARLLMGDGAPADDVAYRAVGLGLHYVAVEIAVDDGARVLIGDAACQAAVVHLDAAAAVQLARVHIAGLDGAAVGIDQTAQAALGRHTAAVPAAGDGAGVAARQGSAGVEGIILALALRHGDIRQLRDGTDIAEQSLSPAIQQHADRVAVAVEGAGIRVLAGADGDPGLIHVRHILLQLRAGVYLTGVHRVPQPDELRRAGDLIGILRRAAAAGLRAGGVGQHRGLIGVRLSRQRQHRGSRRVIFGEVQLGRLLLGQGQLRLVDGVQLAGDLVRVGVRDVLRCR